MKHLLQNNGFQDHFWKGQLPEDRRIFNEWLSCARRQIENAFGILVASWHIFLWPISASVGTVQSITQAAVCLHNYLRQTNNACYCPVWFVDSEDSTGQICAGDWKRIVEEGCNGALRPCVVLEDHGARNLQLVFEKIWKRVLSPSNGTMSGARGQGFKTQILSTIKQQKTGICMSIRIYRLYNGVELLMFSQFFSEYLKFD